MTIVLTTHYIEEAEQMADRVGVINNGEIIVVEEKTRLMQELGRKQLFIQLQQPLEALPKQLKNLPVELLHDGHELCYTYDTRSESTGITALLRTLQESGIHFNDLHTSQSSLEDIFVDLVRRTE